MQTGVVKESFVLVSEGLRLKVFVAAPERDGGPFPSVQIHHAGGGYEPVYEHMAVELAQRGILGIAMIHRGYPGSQGDMEYGKGEITDIGNLTQEIRRRPDADPDRIDTVHSPSCICRSASCRPQGMRTRIEWA